MEPQKHAQNVPEKLLKPYDPAFEEKVAYELWEKSGYFNPEKMIANGHTTTDAKPFTIVLPPPNVTGVLHLGHAYEDSLQDSLIRFERMRGKKTLWVPGTDSAAIATQSRVEKNIQKEEGKNRYDLGREELVNRVAKFAKESEHTIINQVKSMGASLDWSRYAYTLDEHRSFAVTTAFVRMYDEGLIYRGHRIVNWDPKGQTTISDDEIVYEPRKSMMYTFKYSHDFPIAISTTRPETKVGDVAVAVHPDDTRYSDYVGKEYDVVFCGAPIHIKIIADVAVEKDFGTGALGVTPAHSMIDWEMADRHDLSRPQVINEYAKMTGIPEDSPVFGKKVGEARDIIVAWLREQNLLIDEKEIDQNIATSERTGGIIEPLPKLQWFINVNKEFTIKKSQIPTIEDGESITLKKMMEKTVRGGGVSFAQENFEKVYFNWIANLRDWCISRQIWFGHRIPVWYKEREIYCGTKSPSGDGWEQDPDVLDTWFSSALWTFSTLGWPNNTTDLTQYHPTSVMSPAYEILPLWVSRMILMSGFHLGQAPFKTVLIHGLVRAKDGRKFSKSLNNGVDPLELIQKYGADALRMGLLVGTSIGNDLKFDENKVKGYKLFSNKIWNITRFILSNSDGLDLSAPFTEQDQSHYDTWKKIASEITSDIEEYNLHTASESIYHYIWDTLASSILEESKALLASDDTKTKQSRQKLLYTLLTESIAVLHPFMPFVTETIWQILPHKERPLLMISKWPSV